MKFVVLSVAGSAPDTLSNAIEMKFRTALDRWTDVAVVSPYETEQAVGSRVDDPLTSSRTRAVAKTLGARNYIVAVLEKDGAAWRIRAQLRDAANPAFARAATAPLNISGTDSSSIFDALVYSLLFPQDDAQRFLPASKTTRSFAAFRKYVEGRQASVTWNLPLAESAFAASSTLDPNFDQANFWLAQVRYWKSGNSADIGRIVKRGIDGGHLIDDDRLAANGLYELTVKNWPAACTWYDNLLERDSLSFTGWYGRAECNRWDPAVIRAPGGQQFVFRSSVHRGVTAITRAFDLLPAQNDCCVERVAEILRDYFRYVKVDEIRVGFTSDGQGMPYGAYAEQLEDTIAFHPVSVNMLQKSPDSKALAVRRQRNLLYTAAVRRVAQSPTNSYSLELLATAMELQGLPEAVDTIRRARAVATTQPQMVRLSVREVWLLVKNALPDDERRLTAARLLADSLLRIAKPANENDATLLASIAALVGDVNKAGIFASFVGPAKGRQEVPPEVEGDMRSFLVLAAMGAPVDSIAVREKRIEIGIANGVLPQHLTLARNGWLGRGAAVALPVYGRMAFGGQDTASLLGAAGAAFSRQDNRATRDLLARISATRVNIPPAEISLEVLYPEAWLLMAVGDSVGALARLRPTLDAIRSIPTDALMKGVAAGSLVQAMRLRSRLTATPGGSPESRRWFRAVQAITGPNANTQ